MSLVAESRALVPGWTEGKAVGFIASSTFHRDYSGNELVEKEVLFFQHDWTLSSRESGWRSIVELGGFEETEADRYDKRNRRGRYDWMNWVGHGELEPMVLLQPAKRRGR